MTSGGTGTGAKDPPPMPERIASRVASLATAGLGRNEIARRLDVSTATVTRAAEHAGVTFDTAATEVATRSRSAQLADARADVAELAAILATKAGRRLGMELDAEILDPTAVRALATAFGVSSDKLTALTDRMPEDRDEHAAARTWLAALHLQLSAAGEGLIEPDEDGNYPIQYGPPQEDTE